MTQERIQNMTGGEPTAELKPTGLVDTSGNPLDSKNLVPPKERSGFWQKTMEAKTAEIDANFKAKKQAEAAARRKEAAETTPVAVPSDVASVPLGEVVPDSPVVAAPETVAVENLTPAGLEVTAPATGSAEKPFLPTDSMNPASEAEREKILEGIKRLDETQAKLRAAQEATASAVPGPEAVVPEETNGLEKKGLMEKGRANRLATGEFINKRMRQFNKILDAGFASPELVKGMVGEAQEIGRETNEALRTINQVVVQRAIGATGKAGGGVEKGTLRALGLGGSWLQEVAARGLYLTEAILIFPLNALEDFAKMRARLEERSAKRTENKLSQMTEDRARERAEGLISPDEADYDRYQDLSSEADESRKNAADLREGAQRLNKNIEKARLIKRGLKFLGIKFSRA